MRFTLLSFALGLALLTPVAAAAADAPNIVLIYSDDVGYGDVGCNGVGTIKTPHIDRIAAEGIRFTDAHCSAATCTPSRFALLTGSYAFRQKDTGIRPGDANLIIPPGTPTLPSQLQTAGYKTAVVGKWHLGLGDGPIDWNGEVKPGPNEIGFDYHFLIPATGDRVPCVYLEQGRVVDLDPSDPITVSYKKRIGDAPTGKERPDLLKQKWSHGHNETIVNGISRMGYMTGGQEARWIDEDMADVITGKAVKFIDENQDAPFFLFFASHDIHVPRMPHSRFEGASGQGPRGDAMVQLDWCVGQLLEALDERGLADNTLIMFTSDNGPVLDDGYHDQANELLGDHTPSGEHRAGKYSKFEGGTRVPTVLRWPGQVEPGQTSGALVGQVDFATTMCALAGVEPPTDAFPDSRDQREALLGNDPVGRPHLVHEAWGLALRMGDWKYLPPGGTRDQLGPWKNFRVPRSGALYNVVSDPGETKNLARQEREKLGQMKALLAKLEEEPDGE